LARLGGDEFAILAVDRDEEAARTLYKQLADKLAEVRLSVAIGMAMRDHHSTLINTFTAADQHMYEHKRQLKKAD
jgi:GGDEF domain-containing protein